MRPQNRTSLNFLANSADISGESRALAPAHRSAGLTNQGDITQVRNEELSTVFEVPFALIALKDVPSGAVRGYVLLSPVYVGLHLVGHGSGFDLTDAFSPIARRRMTALIDRLHEGQRLSPTVLPELSDGIAAHAPETTTDVVSVNRRTMAIIERRRFADEFAHWLHRTTGRSCVAAQSADGRVTVTAQV
jgi:hypothetical protein